MGLGWGIWDWIRGKGGNPDEEADLRDDDALLGKLLSADPGFAAFLLARLVRAPLRLH